MKQVNLFSIKSIFDVVLPALLIALLFVTPFIISDELYNGVIVAKEFWFFGVVAAMLLYSGIRMLFKKGSIQINLNITDILLLAFYIWCFIRAIFTPYTPFWHNHKLQVLTGMMVVYFFVKNTILPNERNEGNEDNEAINTTKPHIISFIHFFIISFILSGFLQAIYGLLQLYGIYPSHHNLFQITGSFFNPAPYALYLAVVFPVALGRILFNNAENSGIESVSKYTFSNAFRLFIFKLSHLQIFKFSYYLSLATVIAILLVLPATMIRASWIGAIAGSLVVLQYKYHYLQRIKKFLNSPLRRILTMTLTIVIVALMGAGIYFLKKDSANGKLFIWEVTLGKIAEKPLFGHGLGRFEAEYNNWQAEYFQNYPAEMDGTKGYVAGNTKYAFNEFIEMASEIGIIGLLLFIAAIGSLFYFISSFLHSFINKSSFIPSFFHSYNNSNSYTPSFFHYFIPSLISLLFCAVISFPLYSISTLILLFALISIITMGHKAVLVMKTHQLPLRLSFAGLLIAFSIPQLNILQKIPQYNKWNEANYLYAMSDYNGANSTYKEIIPSIAYEGELIQQYGKSLQMDGINEEAVSALEKAARYTSDYILYTTLGDAYKGIRQYCKAELAYQQASYMEPNKMYPRYLLAKLYDDSGQQFKAIETAKGLLNKDIKVESTATAEIRIEMKRILTNNTNDKGKRQE